MSREYEESTSSQIPVIADGLTLGVVGAGVMGQTLIRGLLNSGLIARENVWAGDKNAAACESAGKELSIPVVSDFADRVATADLILVCVKPADAPRATQRRSQPWAGGRSPALRG